MAFTELLNDDRKIKVVDNGLGKHETVYCGQRQDMILINTNN